MRTGNFAQRGHLGTSYENQARALRVRQGLDRFFVLGALLFKTGQGAEARGVALAFFEKTAPGSWQLQQPMVCPVGAVSKMMWS